MNMKKNIKNHVEVIYNDFLFTCSLIGVADMWQGPQNLYSQKVCFNSRVTVLISIHKFRKAENLSFPKNIRESFREITDVEI